MSRTDYCVSKSFDEDDLAKLTEVYVACCEVLKIPKGATDFRRETVAHIVMVLAISGEMNPRLLQRRTLTHFRSPG